MVFKTLDSRQQRTVIIGTKNKWVSPRMTQLPDFEKFIGPGTEKGNQDGASSLLKLRRWTLESA